MRVSKKNGKGRLEDCEGVITFEQTDGTIFDVHTVWEGVKYSRYRNISINDDLKLFHISEEGKKIFIFTEPDNIDDSQPYKTFTFDKQNLDDEILDTDVHKVRLM